MIWVVTYRDKSGARQTLELDVADKAAVWSELKKRGIQAISVAAGGSLSKGRVSGAAPNPAIVRGLVAGVIVVAASVVSWLVLSPGAPEAEETRAPAGKAARITEATPAAPPVAEEPVEKAKEPAKPKAASWRNPKLTEDQRLDAYEKALEETKLPEESTNRLFRSGLEQVMGWIFTTELGDMPPPLPQVADIDIVHLQEILDYKSKIGKDDTDQQADAKDTVNFAKEELRKYLEKGGSPDEFLAYYHDELQAAFMERNMAYDQVLKVISTEPELASDYVKKVNESLAKKNIKGIVLSPRVLARYGITLDQESESTQQPEGEGEMK